jgi:16S rRNA G966 N2-methylase RsmD
MEEQNNLIETVTNTTVLEKPKRKSKKEKDKEKPILVLTEDIDVQNTDGLKYLQTIQANSVDLILTDPPYII